MQPKNSAPGCVNLPTPVKGVRKIIVVSSGKGGVGKSSVAANLAVALALQGKRTALLDADIYGPSIPQMFSLHQKPVLEDDLMVPHSKYGVKLMSIGFLVDKDSATIWRGPMTTKILYQLLRLSKWEDAGEALDYLIVDMPPGTGDVHLSMAENYVIDGAIIVSTPQELALIDAKKAIDMYNKLRIPIIGLVENMSYFCPPHTDEKHYIFGQEGAQKLAAKHNIPLLASLPLCAEIAAASASGKPLAYYHPQHPAVAEFKQLAAKL
jgi:ATP-binding protein involved in chromosome partitioning